MAKSTGTARSKLAREYFYGIISKFPYKSVQLPQSSGARFLPEFNILVSTKRFQNELKIPKMFLH